MGEPFVVPRDASDPELERSRLRLERELADCEARCNELLAPRGSSLDH